MPSDEFLVASVRGGDEAALSALMDRYDRLVRFAIFRLSKTECVRDPHWLETIAADTWLGFVRSLQRSPETHPKSLSAYLATIARFKVVSARRRASDPAATSLDESDVESGVQIDAADPIDLLVDVETLGILRECVRELDGADQALWAQIEAILDRRWVEAAAGLGISESTLRSRWKRVLERVRDCVQAKGGRDLAPKDGGSDS